MFCNTHRELCMEKFLTQSENKCIVCVKNYVLRAFSYFNKDGKRKENILIAARNLDLALEHVEEKIFLYDLIKNLRDSLSIGLTPLISSFNLLIESIDEEIEKEKLNTIKPVYVITPTGDRQEALNLAIKMMNRQTVKPDLWIIVDDGTEKSNLDGIECPYKVIYCEPQSQNTIIRNCRVGISHVPNNNCKVIMWEDDDYYHPNYIETVSEMLNNHNFVYCNDLWSYHVSLNRYLFKPNYLSSLHNFALTGIGLSYFSECIEENKLSNNYLLDKLFRQYIKDKDEITCFINKISVPIHITGMNCKRKGITPSHVSSKILMDSNYLDDKDYSKLKELVGSDFYENYIPHSRKNFIGNIYIFSNVNYPEINKIKPNEKDLLVFLNKSISANYYKEHLNKIQFMRNEKTQYGECRKDMEVNYVYGEKKTIPDSFHQEIRNNYDFNYEIENGKTKSPTTGYIVAKYMQHCYPKSKIYLVNFGMEVKNSTYRCPWHNWEFENEKLQEFEHINLEEK